MRNAPVAALLLAALSLSAAASAADPPAATAPPAEAPSAEAVRRADDFFREANRLVTQQKWAEAEAKFQAAWELNPTYDVALNLGQTQYRLGKLRDAAEHLAFALRTWPLIGKRDPKEAAEKRLRELKAQLGTLTVQVNVPGASVLVDGKRVGQAPIDFELFVEAGERTVEARASRYADVREVVQIGKGEARGVVLAMKAVEVGEKPPGSVGPVASLAPATTVPSTSPPPWQPGPAWGIAGGAIAAAGLGTGLGLTLAGNTKASNAGAQLVALQKKGGEFPCSSNQFVSDCTTLKSTNQSADTLFNASRVAFAAAGVGGAVLLTYLLWPAPKTPRPEVGAAPVVGSGIAGASLFGTF